MHSAQKLKQVTTELAKHPRAENIKEITSRERTKSAPYLRLKIAKALKSVKKFWLFYSTRMKKIEKTFRIFFEIILKSPVSRIVPKNEKGALWEFLDIHIEQKLKGASLETLKKLAQKSHKAEITYRKTFLV